MNKFRSSLQSGRHVLPDSPLVEGKARRGAEGDDLASVRIAREETRLADHRGGDRHRLEEEQVHAVHKRKTHAVDLINLSQGGAMIRADFAPRLWDRVDLQLGPGAALECAVRWIRGDRIGLEFAHETRIEADPRLRDLTLLEAIRRTLPRKAADEPAAVAAPEPRATPQPIDTSRRTDRRHPLIWTGEVLFNHDSHAVRLRNISASGALVESASALPVGVEVMLDLGQGVQQFATVSWSRGHQSGLTFASPFDLARLAEAKPEVAPSRWMRPTFLDVAPSQESPWDENWDRATIEELRDDLEGFYKR